MKQIQCPNCTYVGEPKRVTPGHFIIELILWLLFFPIGLIYSIWRLSQKHNECPRCSFKHVYNIVIDGAALSSK